MQILPDGGSVSFKAFQMTHKLGKPGDDARLYRRRDWLGQAGRNRPLDAASATVAQLVLEGGAVVGIALRTGQAIQPVAEIEGIGLMGSHILCADSQNIGIFGQGDGNMVQQVSFAAVVFRHV